jgi:DNA-binding XRE family transcriptional regulator
MLKYNNLYQDFGGMPLVPNRLREVRENCLVSKSQLTRKAGISPLTISKVERGPSCRQETKRKILAGLGLSPRDKDRVFLED